MTAEYFETCSRKVMNRARKALHVTAAGLLRASYLRVDETTAAFVATLQEEPELLRALATEYLERVAEGARMKSADLVVRDDRGAIRALALRLLLFTGTRLREVLHLKWEQIDFERGMLFLADSKTGKKTIVLNAPALAVLNGLEGIGPFVIAGERMDAPRADLHRPWDLVRRRAGLEGLRIHDLRHTYASFGAGGGLGLPIIGKLLGHAQAATTARYARAAKPFCRRTRPGAS
jgi:integrase